ncbi:MAG TPA: TRAP transporter substrate-binding protein [Burkholderiaceae bacterium]|nr:TRAP transporter substrate-binding protein [Burkholderiaceae bacterium]
MNRRRSLSLAAAAAVFVAAASIAAPEAAAQQRLRVAGNFPIDHTATQAMEVFKKEVERRTNGELQIDLFPAMQLGGANENVDQVRSGTVFAIVTSIAYFTRIVPEYEAVSLPFLFKSRDDAFKVIDGPIGKLFDEKMAQKGFISLGYGELGFRHVTNNVRPIKSVADFKGLKIRLQPNEVHLETFRALGANPVAMDIKEVYSAMQQGVLDGHENPYNIIFTRRFHEVQKHLSNSGHFYDFINAAANKRLFERLSKPHQQAVVESMHAAMKWQRAEAAKLDDGWREKLIQAGMTFTPLSDEARKELRAATAGVVQSLKKRVDPAVIDKVLSAAD